MSTVGDCTASSECLAHNATEDFQLMSTRFSLGIDLGTTNSAIALTDLQTDQTEVLEVTQILGPNQIGEKPTLPSALYIPHRDEFPENSFPLPWESGVGDATIAHYTENRTRPDSALGELG